MLQIFQSDQNIVELDNKYGKLSKVNDQWLKQYNRVLERVKVLSFVYLYKDYIRVLEGVKVLPLAYLYEV